jgi:outer membrane lipoprotein carrier protein
MTCKFRENSSNLQKMRLLKSGLFILVSLSLSLIASAQTNVHQFAEGIDRHYNNLRTLETKFTESYQGGGMTRVESGTLWLKRPGRMRWQYTEPRAKLFITDGHTAWFYVPGEKQARRMSLKKLEDLRTPLAFMLGKTKLEKEFNGLSFAPDVPPSLPGDVVLRGVPRNMPDVSDVVFDVAPDGSFRRIVVHQLDGSSTEFTFRDQKDNSPVTDGRFKFSPPPGVETVDADKLDQ